MAERLRRAVETGVPVAPVRDDLPDGDMAGAYAVQRRNVELAVTQGRRVVGRKVGLTSKAVQAQLGVDEPDEGVLFADCAVDDGGTVATGRLLQPRVEAEVAFVLAGDLDRGMHTVADVLGVTAFVLPALEIVDSRIADWDVTIVDTVADNASAGLFVLGTRPVPLHGVDLAGCEMTLARADEVVSTGTGANCLGHPLHAVRWLADAASQAGRPLRAGDVVLSGALGPMVPAQPGDAFRADITGLGSVAVFFEEVGARP